MAGWVGVGQPNDDLELTEDVGCTLGVVIDDVEGSTPLSVHAHVLGETLSDNHLETQFHELTDGEGVLLYATTGVALVR
jgi:hypothetical protein